MKIKVFTKNKDGKIEFTEDELKKLLDEVYWEGYNDHPHTWTWRSPYVWTNDVNDITVSSSGVNDFTVSNGITSTEVTVKGESDDEERRSIEDFRYNPDYRRSGGCD